MLARSLGLGGKFGGDRFLAHLLAVYAVEINCLLRDQINNALKIVFAADRQLHQNGVAIQFGAQLFDDVKRIGPGAVHFVDKRQARDMVAPHLPVDGKRLGLHAAHCAKHQDCPVEHAQAAFDFHGKIHVAGSVDQIDYVIAPLHGSSGTGDGDAPFLFQFHVVHGGATAVVHFLHAVNAAGVVQDPLAQGGLARVDMGRYADIT